MSTRDRSVFSGIVPVNPLNYGTINTPAPPDMPPQQNNLLTSSDSGTNALNREKGLKPHERRCRVITFLSCLVLLVVTITAFVILVVLPTGHSQHATIQNSVTTLLSVVKSYYFNVRITRDENALCSVNISAVPCSSLHTYVGMYSGTVSGHQAKGYDYQKFESLNHLAYLVSGSLVDIEVNVTTPPLSSDDVIVFYIFDDWNKYNLFGEHTNVAYFKRFNISSIYATRITFSVVDTGFYFYGLALPDGTEYYFNYDLKRVSYNFSSSDRKCDLSVETQSCFLQLSDTHDEQCILTYCSSGQEWSNDSFYSIQSQLIRRPMNSITSSVMSVTIALIFLVIAILLYDTYRRHFDAKFTTWDTCICKRDKQ